jgi:hypothetical protein
MSAPFGANPVVSTLVVMTRIQMASAPGSIRLGGARPGEKRATNMDQFHYGGCLPGEHWPSGGSDRLGVRR